VCDSGGISLKKIGLVVLICIAYLNATEVGWALARFICLRHRLTLERAHAM
jgi:hypothetical protein